MFLFYIIGYLVALSPIILLFFVLYSQKDNYSNNKIYDLTTKKEKTEQSPNLENLDDYFRTHVFLGGEK